MHPTDILKYGHQTIVQSVNGLVEQDWNLPGACGYWSVREIIAHLASFEHLLIDVLQLVLDKNNSTSILQRFADEGIAFNDNQVALRKDQMVAETWNEYKKIYHQSFEIFNTIPVQQHKETGLLTFYGEEYDLEDFLVYTFYGHKREHGAQINAFRDILEQQKVTDTYA